MNTTISIGYIANSFSRKMRLMNAFQTAGAKCESNMAGLQRKVAGISDVEGELAIFWAVLPKTDEIEAFGEAWTSAGGEKDSVTHVWVGMPDKPLVKSIKADTTALSALCKKMADLYYREYILENESINKHSNTSDADVSKEPTILDDPEWDAMQSEFLQMVKGKA